MTPNSPAPARKSLPLSQSDIEMLEILRVSSTHRQALERLAGVGLSDDTSEARLLHAVVQAGFSAVRLEVEDAGYAALAGETDRAAAQRVARRRRPSWEAE